MELKDLNTFGCPCYVLDRELQNEGMTPKWDPRSRLGVYLRQSPCHTGSVAPVLNPKTLHVSPQFHVALYNTFSTVPYLASLDVPPKWSILVKESETASQQDYDLARTWVDSQQDPHKYLQDQEGERLTDGGDDEKRVAIPEGATDQNETDLEGASNLKISAESNKRRENLLEPTLPDLNKFTSRRSNRITKPTHKARNSHDKRV